MKTLSLFIAILSFLVSCDQHKHMASFEFSPLPDVDAKVFVIEVENGSAQYSTVVFDYLIYNSSENNIKLTANNVRANINGVETVDAKYSSLASAPDAEFQIDKGESKHKLFFIIDSTALSKGIRNFEMVDSGLSIIKN
jgi:hypothetical protein